MDERLAAINHPSRTPVPTPAATQDDEALDGLADTTGAAVRPVEDLLTGDVRAALDRLRGRG